jgi:ATP-dependent helicase/DNAse subunit B
MCCPVSLTIVTGPANSAKAQLVLERYRAALSRAPILVVPRAADVEHYRRELAESGVVLGPAVAAFGGLLREIAGRVGRSEPVLGESARARVLERTVAAERLEALAGAAAAPGFVPALVRLVAELESRRIAPARFSAALRLWASPGTARRRRFAAELASLYGGYRRALERLGVLDAELAAVAALDALRLEPARWGATPVFCYGFDDLEPLQLDAVETLAHRVNTEVVLSLPGEPGRLALAGRAATLETLRSGAEQVIELPPQAAFYEDPVLHHLERSLFADGPQRVASGAAVRLLEGGDERAEAELVATEIAELVARGCAAGDIAVVTRGPQPVAPLIARALDAVGVPHIAPRREPFAATSLGGGILALLRVAREDGEAADLVRWLRVPGVVAHDGLVDRFEARLLRGGITALRPARELWERDHWPLDAADRLRAAVHAGSRALLDRVERELDAMLAAPVRRAAAAIDPWDAAALVTARRALGELRDLEDGAIGGEALAAALGELVVELPGVGERDAVVIGDALALRARRVRALFIAAAQEHVFPAPAREPAFLSAAERAELARAAGLVLEQPLDALATERSLFYALCSRPTAWLRISWHDATDADDAALRSLFVDDLADCFERTLESGRRIRGAGAVAWQGEIAAPPRLQPLERALHAPRHRGAVLGPAAGARLAALRGHDPHSPSALESWARCPVDWFVERGLRLRSLAPEEVPLLRGSLAHDLLRTVFAALVERSGSGRLDAATLPVALEALDVALANAEPSLSPRPPEAHAEQHRLRIDLRRYLEFAASSPSAFEPRELELAFGLPGDERGPVALDGLELCGRIDRVDVDAASGRAIIVDYKTGGAVDPAARWCKGRGLQPALYMLAAERLLHVEIVAGLYQPLRARDLRPRGVARTEVDVGLAVVDNDRRDAGELRELLSDQLELARRAAGELAAGRLEPRPQTCSPGGRCRHPAICRCEGR